MASLPAKLFFRIGEVAGLVGVEPHVLRYWEREFRTIRPTKSAKGQRVYSRKDVENLLRVRDLLYRDGFTIAGAKKRLQRGAHESPSVAALPEPADPLELIDHANAAVEVAEADEVARVSVKPPSSTAERTSVRGKLEAMRVEVEAFLGELEDDAAPGSVD